MSAFISFLEKIGLIFDPTVQQEFYSNGEPFYVSFEGLGIGKFKVNPVAIPIGNGIRFYGIIITAAIVLAFLYVAKWRAKDEGYHYDDLLDLLLFVVPIGVLGARLFYVVTYGGYTFSDWFRIWDGGLAIYGGIIFGAIAVFAVAEYKKMRILRLMDCVAPSVMIAQAIGRWGNFFNGEAYGASTSSFLRMGLSNTLEGAQHYVHPTFLYESLWNVLGFVLINIFYRKKKFDGQIVLEYVGWYGLGRFFIELMRQDSLPLKIGQYNLKISSIIGLLCFAFCLVIFLIFILKPKSPALALPCYYPGAKRLLLKEKEAEKKAGNGGKADGTVFGSSAPFSGTTGETPEETSEQAPAEMPAEASPERSESAESPESPKSPESPESPESPGSSEPSGPSESSESSEASGEPSSETPDESEKSSDSFETSDYAQS